MSSWRKGLPVAFVVALVGLTACASSPQERTAAASHRARLPAVQASRSSCGKGWTHASAGLVQVDVRNTDTNPAEVYVADATGKVYGEIDPLGPGTSAVLTASLRHGKYHLICSVNDADPVDGPAVTVTGSAAGGVGVEPVTSAQLAPVVIAYQKWVGGRLKVMQSQAKTLLTDLRRGARAAARTDLLKADYTWATMGGAYEAFGDTGDAIDGNAFALPKGVNDPHWTGLLRLEYGLWHGQPVTSLVKYGVRLGTDLGALETTLKTTQFDPLDVVLRSHEITEGSLQQTLTGHNDYGAHAELTEVRGQLSGTGELLNRLEPIVRPRYPDYPDLVKQIAKTKADLAVQHGWRVDNPGQPPSHGHQLIDGDIAELAEQLSHLPAMLEPRVFTAGTATAHPTTSRGSRK